MTLSSEKVRRRVIETMQRWEESFKIGQIVPLLKKGDCNDPNNYRGVCLLPMASRILARLLSRRLREWSESLGLLDENESGFRPGRSTADASQMLVRIQEDMVDLRRRKQLAGAPLDDPCDPEARLLDPTKAYPRVNKPALWEILRRYGMSGDFLDTLMDLHESTSYCIKGREGDSDTWTPQRGLREGCPSSPCLFNIYHQVVMRVAEIERSAEAAKNSVHVGISWRWLPGNRLRNPGKTEFHNSEASGENACPSLCSQTTPRRWGSHASWRRGSGSSRP